ncbi:MAG: Clp protease N-terminal domain-containing protein, partial [Cyanobacteria bacterium P01_F01_bin.143]
MFERFTEKAIKVIMLAQEEARRLDHNFVGTEQILLGLIGEGTGIASKVIRSMGVDLKNARIEVEKIIGRGSDVVEKEIPFTPRAKRILELSIEESGQLKDNHIGTEHLLLAIIFEGESIAARVLENLGIDLLKVRAQVLRMLNKNDNQLQDSDKQSQDPDKSKPSLFERFTEKAIKVIMLAQEESRRLGHNFVGTEQILLGLIGEGTDVAATVLKSQGVNLQNARIEVEKIIGRGSVFVAVEIPFTSRAKRVLELSIEEARQLGHNYIGTEHLLLGIIREGEGVAARVLENLANHNLSNIRTQILQILNKDKDITSQILQITTQNTSQNQSYQEEKAVDNHNYSKP